MSTILLVDDEATFAETLAYNLQREGYSVLLADNGMALTRDLLLERVWGLDFAGDSRTVDVHIRWLREKVEVDPSRPRLIHTVRGIGYRFDAAEE